VVLDISRIPNRGLGRWLRLPLAILPDGMVLPVLQGPLRGKRWIKGSSNNGCWLGSYESTKSRLFARLIEAGDVVYDLGANVGYYTMIAAVRTWGSGQVHAFEPAPRNLDLLRQHLVLNRISNVEIHAVAVTDHSGSEAFHDGDNPSMGQIRADGRMRVPTIRLDDLVFSKGLRSPDIIKMDIEGGSTARWWERGQSSRNIIR